MALKVGELFASFNLDTSGVDKSIGSIEKSLGNIGSGMMKAGTVMSAAITAPLVKIGKDMYTAGSNFDAQMSKVFAIGGDAITSNAEAMEQLRAKALEMGSTTKFTASEAGQAFEYMAMAGWKTEAMLGGIEPILNLAAAAGEDLGTTSDIVTDAMTAFGYTIDKVGGDTEQFTAMTTRFSDVLAAVSSNANTNVSMLGESFKYVGSIAGSMGYSIDDTALALGIMANSGIKASQAGTSLRTIMTRLNGEIKIGGKNMKEVTIKTANEKGEMRDFADIIADCRKAFSGLTESEKTQMAQTLVGRNAMSGFLTLMNASEEDVLKLTGAIKNSDGATKRMADTMLDNVEGSLTLFKSAVEGLEVTLWDFVKGSAKSFIDRATGLVDSFRTMDKESLGVYLKFGALAAAAGPFLITAGKLVKSLPKLASGLAALSSPLGAVAIGLGVFAVAAIDSNNVIGRSFENLATKGADSLKKLKTKIYQTFFAWNYETGEFAIVSQMKQLSESLVKGLQTIIPAAFDTAGAMIEAFFTGVSGSASELTRIASTITTGIYDGITSWFPKLVPLAAEMVTNLASAVIEAAPGLLDSGIRMFTTLLSAINDIKWGDIGTKIRTSVETALSEIKTNLFTLVFGEEPAEGEETDWGKFGSKVVEHMKEAIGKASQNGKNLLGNLFLGDDYNPDESWGTVAGKIWNMITTTMGELLKGASDLVTGLVLGDDYNPDDTWDVVATKIWQRIKDAFAVLKTNAKDLIGRISMGDNYTADASWAKIGTKIWEKIQSGVTLAKSFAETVLEKLGTVDIDVSQITTKILNAGAFVTDLVGKMLGGRIEWGTKISGIATKIADQLSGFNWAEVGTQLGQTAGKLLSSLVDMIPNAVDAAGNLLNIGMSLAGGILEAIVSGITAIADSGIGNQLGETAKELLKGILENIGNLGNNESVQNFMKTLGEGMKAAVKFVGNLVGDILAYIFSEEGLRDIYNAGKSLIGLLWDGLKAGLTAAGDLLGYIGGKLFGYEYHTEDEWAEIYGDSLGKDFAETMVAAFSGSVDSSNLSDRTSQVLTETVGGLFRDAIGGIDEKIWMYGSSDNIGQALQSAIVASLGGDAGLYIAPELRDYIKTLSPDIWTAIASGIQANGGVAGLDIRTLIAEALAGKNGEAEASENEVIQKYAEELGTKTKESVENAVTEMAQGMNDFGQNGLATAIAEGKDPVSQEFLELGDAAVQKVLITMSYDNGHKIGSDFISGITFAVNEMNESLYQTAETIGSNFGQGFVNGITSKIADAQIAASNLGAAAGTSLSSATREGSPSRWTAEIGTNFGLGFINAIDTMSAEAAESAAMLGRSAGDALMYTVRGISDSVASEASYERPSAYARTETVRNASQASNGDVAAMTDRIVEALNQIGVYIDGESAGRMLTPYVSEEMAHGTSVRR